MRSAVFPPAVAGRPYPTAVLLGAVLLTVVALGYGLVFALASPHAAARVVLVDVAVAVLAGIVAVLVGRGRVASLAALDATAAVVLAAAYLAVLNEIAATPDRAAPLTTHCCLVLTAMAVIVRHRFTFVVFVLAAPLAWWLVVAGLDTPGFDPTGWLPTIGFTVAVAVAVFAPLATEWWTANTSLGRVEALATLDDLTGLANRRGLALQAGQLAALARHRLAQVWLRCAYVRSANDVSHANSPTTRSSPHAEQGSRSDCGLLDHQGAVHDRR